MRQRYLDINFKQESLDLIQIMDGICRDYMRQGYVLTVRQLYYQLVAKAIIPNKEQSYKRITGLVNDARLAGILDWSAIEDRTRSFIERARYTSVSERIDLAAKYYHMDMWANQETRMFVIVEKEALAGVLERVCYEYDVPLLAARGYPSGTVLREFAEDKILPSLQRGQQVVILHLGDHDPSGIDMTRDLTERLMLFTDRHYALSLDRIALSMDQIDELQPPPNPAKTTDSRFSEYLSRYGNESWELDALDPSYLNRLVETHINFHRDPDRWASSQAKIDECKAVLGKLSDLANDHDAGEIDLLGDE